MHCKDCLSTWDCSTCKFHNDMFDTCRIPYYNEEEEEEDENE